MVRDRRRVSVLIVNGGLAGTAGNSHVVCQRASQALGALGEAAELIVLRDQTPARLKDAIERSTRLVFVTGTYWGGFSSHLQNAFEQLTPTEAGTLWLGKPASVLVSAHQVGGQSVLFRLQGTLSLLGCVIPPMSGIVVSKVAEELRCRAPELCTDVWGLDDIHVAMHNLLACPIGNFTAWNVDRDHYEARWLRE